MRRGGGGDEELWGAMGGGGVSDEEEGAASTTTPKPPPQAKAPPHTGRLGCCTMASTTTLHIGRPCHMMHVPVWLASPCGSPVAAAPGRAKPCPSGCEGRPLAAPGRPLRCQLLGPPWALPWRKARVHSCTAPCPNSAPGWLFPTLVRSHATADRSYSTALSRCVARPRMMGCSAAVRLSPLRPSRPVGHSSRGRGPHPMAHLLCHTSDRHPPPPQLGHAPPVAHCACSARLPLSVRAQALSMVRNFALLRLVRLHGLVGRRLLVNLLCWSPGSHIATGAGLGPTGQPRLLGGTVTPGPALGRQ